jgi:hypothetical protein
VIAFAPPLDQTPTFPTIVLVGTLVTVEAPRTVKLAKSEPSIGSADAMGALKSAANAATMNKIKNLYFLLDPIRLPEMGFVSLE